METHYRKEVQKEKNYSKERIAELPEWIQKLDFYLSNSDLKNKYKKPSSET